MGEKKIKEISDVLEKLNTLEDLVSNESLLKKEFRSLAALMIEADAYYTKHHQESFRSRISRLESDRLKYEMTRICLEIEGGEAFLEKLQSEILDKIDVYERKHKKKAS